MKGKEKENYLTLKDEVLNSYRAYYKDSKHERELPNIYIKNNKSNKFLIRLEKDLHNFLGKNNYPKIQTLGDILYLENNSIGDKNENALRLYIAQVSRVLNIRELKNKLVKLISTNEDKLEALQATPNTFSKELALAIRNTIKVQDELAFGNDILILFTDDKQHYLIKDSSIEDIKKYLLNSQNSSEKDKEKEVISNVKSKNAHLPNDNEIKTVLNIKKEGSWFKRYQTILAFVFSTFIIPVLVVMGLSYFLFPDHAIIIMILSNVIQLISIVTIVMGFYYTYKYVKNSKVILWRTIIFIVGFLINLSMVIYAGYSMVNGKLNMLEEFNMQNINEGTFGSYFNPDPTKTGIGFLTVNSTNNNDTANVYDQITLPKLEGNQEYVFWAFIDFHNQGKKEIKDARATIHFKNDSTNGVLILTGKLSGQDVGSIFDTVNIYNFNSNYEVVFQQGYIENTHAETDPEYCQGYNYRIDIGKEIVTTGVSLDVLDTYYNGWCDQGYVIVQFSIRKKTPS